MLIVGIEHLSICVWSDYFPVTIVSLGRSLNSFNLFLSLGHLASVKPLALFRRKGLNMNSKRCYFVFSFSQTPGQGICFFSYSGIYVVACLLVKCHPVGEHFSRRKKSFKKCPVRKVMRVTTKEM